MCLSTTDWYPAKEGAGQSVILKLQLIWELWSKEQGASLDSIRRSAARFFYDLGQITVNPGHQISIERCANTFESLNFNHIVSQFSIC